jgi:hypothetical protein
VLRPSVRRLGSVAFLVVAATACHTDSTKPSIPLAMTPIKFAGGSRAIFDSLQFWVTYVDSVGNPTSVIIDTVLLKGPTADAKTRRLGDPGFAQMAALMTDGVDQLVQRNERHGGGSTITSLESAFFLPGTLAPDFQGDVITKVQLVVDTLTFATPGLDPNHDGLWTDFEFVARLVVEGYQQ